MALCRCNEKHANPKGRKEEYVKSVKPLGYPETSSICGRINCSLPGFIWLTKNEYNKYLNNERVFTYSTNATKVKVE
jgi:hypothetical protein